LLVLALAVAGLFTVLPGVFLAEVLGATFLVVLLIGFLAEVLACGATFLVAVLAVGAVQADPPFRALEVFNDDAQAA
jgi:hypothetical protein